MKTNTHNHIHRTAIAAAIALALAGCASREPGAPRTPAWLAQSHYNSVSIALPATPQPIVHVVGYLISAKTYEKSDVELLIEQTNAAGHRLIVIDQPAPRSNNPVIVGGSVRVVGDPARVVPLHSHQHTPDQEH